MLPFNLECLLFCAFCVPGVITKYTPSLTPSFYFDYNKPGGAPPVPVTDYCDEIHITWNATVGRGTMPTPPFYAQVFASSSKTPFLISVGNGSEFYWRVPFDPGTQYQICMYDRNGVSGGCQAIYTVVPSSTIPSPDCQNLPTAGDLSVVVTKPDGPRSQYGFIGQCTDMIVTPTLGKPPFLLTVAPSLHPPFNITSNSMSPITWTVSLTPGSSFFVGLSSSDGLMWSTGPMHASGSERSDCLTPGSMTVKRTTSINIALGVGIGSAIGGIIFGLSAAYFLTRYRRRRIPPSAMHEKDAPLDDADIEADHPPSPLPTLPAQHARLSQGLTLFNGIRPESCTVEPFIANPSPGFAASGKARMEGRWRGLAFATMNSSRYNLPSRLRNMTRPRTPSTYSDTVPHSSAPSYSITAESENPPGYVANPA